MIIGEEEIPNERALLTQEDGPMMASSASVKYIVIHCSATRSTRDYTAEQLLRDHKTRGFRTVGYHFYIRRDGSVTQHRKLLEVGAHCRPWNRCSIGICYEGGLDADGHPADTRTPEQTEQFILLLMRMVKIFPGVRIRGHRVCREVSRRLVRVSMRRGYSGTWRNNKESGNHHAVSSLGETAWRMPLRMICFSL